MQSILTMVSSTAESGNTRSAAHTIQEKTNIQKPNNRLVQLMKYKKN